MTGRRSQNVDERKAAYQKATQILNDNHIYVWVYRYTAALIATDQVRGLRAAEEAGFANITSKPWYQDLWLAPR